MQIVRKILRAIKMLLLMVFISISALGLVVSTLSYFVILFERDLSDWVIAAAIVFIPIVFIPATLIAVAKTAINKNEDYRYGIRFWPAIRNISKQFAVAIYILALNIGLMMLLNYFGFGSDLVVLLSGMMLFYYVPTLIYFSSLKKNIVGD